MLSYSGLNHLLVRGLSGKMSMRQAGPRGGQGRQLSLRVTITLAVAAVVVLGLALARFALPDANGVAEGPAFAHVINASPIATATPIAGSNQISGNQVLQGATPLATDVAQGYQDPSKDTAQEQALRAQDGNPAKVIMVSLQGQFIQAFQNGKLVRWAYVTTGRPGMETPTGFYNVFLKQSPLTFLPISTVPGNPDFGFPSKVQYGMEFAQGGFYIHDVWWRTVYGPGTEYDHWDPGRGEPSPGSHGCVNTPLELMAWLYVWTPMGTPVIVY